MLGEGIQFLTQLFAVDTLDLRWYFPTKCILFEPKVGQIRHLPCQSAHCIYFAASQGYSFLSRVRSPREVTGSYPPCMLHTNKKYRQKEGGQDKGECLRLSYDPEDGFWNHAITYSILEQFNKHIFSENIYFIINKKHIDASVKERPQTLLVPSEERGRTTNGEIGPVADHIHEVWNCTIFVI